MRGEHLDLPSLPVKLSGSSPHARGALDEKTVSERVD